MRKNIFVCGGGAIGSHFILFSRDIENISLAVVDDDRVEAKNLASQWFSKQTIGKKKAESLRMQNITFFGEELKPFSVRLTELNIKTLFDQVNPDLVVECFDNFYSRRLVQDFVKEHKIPCVHACLSANGEFGAIRWTEFFTPDKEDVEGQPTCEGKGFLPMIATLSSALVVSVKDFLADQNKLNWNISRLKTDSFLVGEKR